jgi:ABC-type polysaccharide/polyol phosphate transport system ATPase subunit
MVSRLGFAIATAREAPGIFILDEVLSVGDMHFGKKSKAKINELIHSGSTVLIVSHSLATIRGNCTSAIWIEKSKLMRQGDVKHVCDAYERKDLHLSVL